jgi:3-phenylpropionate/trans-cinnamate dioxygenase ferredoxin subunit
MSEYAKIGSLSELTSGEMKMVTLNGEDILLANVGGKIHAVSDLCSHAEASLSDGYIEDDEVECPLHGSRFSITTGEALSLPADEPLKLYDVKVEGDDILVRVT